MTRTAAAILAGLIAFGPTVEVAGVIFNRVSSSKHAEGLPLEHREIGWDLWGFLPSPCPTAGASGGSVAEGLATVPSLGPPAAKPVRWPKRLVQGRRGKAPGQKVRSQGQIWADTLARTAPLKAANSSRTIGRCRLPSAGAKQDP